MNIFIHDLKQKKKNIIIWSISTIVFILASMIKSSAFVGDSSSNDLMDSLPQGFLALFGMSGIDISTYEGYYGIVYVYLLIAVAVYAIITVSSLFKDEKEFLTAEYLYSKPKARIGVAISKVVAALSIITIYQIVVAAIITLYFDVILDAGISDFIFELHVHAYLLSLMFFGLTLLFMSIKDKYSMLSFIVLLVLYLLGSVDQLMESPDILTYSSPFIFFSSTNIFEGNQNMFMYLYVMIPCIIGSILFLSTFSKKEFL